MVAESENQHSFYATTGKRAFDILFAILLLPIVAPVIFLLWAAIKIQGESGCFAHDRVGRNGKIFKCWKIRTMHTGSNESLDVYLESNSEAAAEWERNQKIRRDSRVTRLGRILRKTSLDELPQIWNVLVGDMSFVGPRPVVSTELQRYGVRRRSYLAVRPGITGLWQVSGRNSVSYAKRVALDVKYERRLGFFQDLKILFRTTAVILEGDGF